jgi:hypothetical protein
MTEYKESLLSKHILLLLGHLDLSLSPLFRRNHFEVQYF